jgi:tetratricopeptide (TPR) repeat protein
MKMKPQVLRTLFLPVASLFLALLCITPPAPTAGAAEVSDLMRRGAELFRAGQFKEAARQFEEALDKDPLSETARRSLGHALASAGQQKYRAGDLESAREYLEGAIDQWPEEPAFHLLLGVVSFHSGDLYGARRAVEEVLALDEGNPQGHELLGDIYYQEGYLTRAIPEWESALETPGPHSSRLRARIDRAERESDAESGFGRDVSVHFTLQYDDTVPRGVADAILQEMEDAYDSIGSELGSYPSTDIPVILYSKILFTEITRKPLWVAGTFDGKIRVPVRGLSSPGDVARIRPILIHELAHAFILAIAPRGLPLWFQEGLAKHFEGAPTSGAEAYLERHGGSFPRTLHGLNGGLRGRGGSVEASYLAALLAVRLIIDEEGFWTVRRVLESVGKGVPFEEAFREETRLETLEFQERWLSSLP